MALATVETGGSNPRTLFGGGSVTAPSIAFRSQPTTGWYYISAGLVGYASAGVLSLSFDTGGKIQGAVAATSLLLAGAVDSAAARNIVLQTNNAAGTGLVTRLTIGSNAATAAITFANSTITGMVLGGGINCNSQNLTNVNVLTGVGNLIIYSAVTNSAIDIKGGGNVAGGGATISFKGTGTNNGTMYFYTPNAAADTDTLRLDITGNVATAVATWTTVTHTGFVATNSIALGTAGSALGTLNINGNTSGTVSVTVAAAAGTYTMTLPSGANTNAGYQLTCAGADTITSWAAAASVDEVKNFVGDLDPYDALRKILSVPLKLWNYKKGMGTQDSETLYAGARAADAPWAMHFGETITNPVNTYGYAWGAIQALHSDFQAALAKIARLEAQVAALQG